MCAYCSAAEIFSFCMISQWHTTWNLRRGKIRATKLGEWKSAIFLERPFRIFPSRILPRARLWYARHACMLFGEEPRERRGGGGEERNSAARLAQMRRFITNDDEKYAREAWSRNDQVHLFFVLVNVSSWSRPRWSLGGRPLPGQGRPDALVSYNCLVSTRKKNCAVGKRTFRREKTTRASARLVSRCINENKKRERERERERRKKNIKEREPCGSSISVDRIPKRKRTPAFAPIDGGGGGGGDGGPFMKSRDADRRVFMFAPRILPLRANKETHVSSVSHSIFMNFRYALLESGPKRKTTAGVF